MPLDEEGNLVRQSPTETTSVRQMAGIAPPGYGEHILDQLYEDLDVNGLNSGLQTPAIQSGVNTPFYTLSRAGSAENLHQMAQLAGMSAVPPAALSSRLQDVSLDPSHRNQSYNSLNGMAMTDGATTPHSAHPPTDSNHNSPPPSASLSRSHSGEDLSGINTPEHVELEDLSRVPSYSTAVKTPVRPLSMMEGMVLPDYNAAVSVPSSPTLSTTHMANPLDSIPEARTLDTETQAPPPRPRPSRRQTSLGFSNLLHHHRDHHRDHHREQRDQHQHNHHHTTFEEDVRRRLHLMQARAQPY